MATHFLLKKLMGISTKLRGGKENLLFCCLLFFGDVFVLHSFESYLQN